jgi:hypothetical protein
VSQKKQPIPASELMASLEADPEWVAQRDARVREQLLVAERLRDEQRPLTDDLKVVGLEIGSVFELVASTISYPEALPVLLEHFSRPYSDRVREGIARSLAVPEMQLRWNELLDLYVHEAPGSGAKDGLAVALASVASRSLIDDLVGLAKDRRHGSSRILLLRRLHDSRTPAAIAALRELSDDPDTSLEARRLLQGKP